jgi:hypothetical protein
MPMLNRKSQRSPFLISVILRVMGLPSAAEPVLKTLFLEIWR